MKNVTALTMTVGLILPLWACNHQQQFQKSSIDPYLHVPLHVSYDIIVRFSDSSFTRAVLKAGRAEVDEVQRETLLGNGVFVTFNSRVTGEPSAWLKADSAIIDDRTKDMTAIGNVHVHSDSSNTSLTTSRLVWDQSKERITSSEYVKITTPSEIIEGVGFVSDQHLTNYRIFQVRGIYRQ